MRPARFCRVFLRCRLRGSPLMASISTSKTHWAPSQSVRPTAPQSSTRSQLRPQGKSRKIWPGILSASDCIGSHAIASSLAWTPLLVAWNRPSLFRGTSHKGLSGLQSEGLAYVVRATCSMCRLCQVEPAEAARERGLTVPVRNPFKSISCGLSRWCLPAGKLCALSIP